MRRALPSRIPPGLALVAFLVAASAASSACTPPPTYLVRRAALVQAPAPPTWSGKIHGSGVALGDSTVLWRRAPHGAPESESGLYVARTQLDGALRLRVHENLALWIPASYGLQAGAFDAVPCLTEAPDAGVITLGVGLGVGGDLDERWSLSASAELMGTSVPSRVQWTCVADCWTAEPSGERQDSETVAVLRASLVAGYRLSWGRIFGGVAVRNHPTNVRISVESQYSTAFIDDEVSGGPFYALPGAGVEVDVTDFFSVALQLYQPLPLAQHDLIYGPVGGLMLDLHAASQGAAGRW